MKRYNPYRVVAKTEEAGIDRARLDEALEAPKGYQCLRGEEPDAPVGDARQHEGSRNNYRLTNLRRMQCQPTRDVRLPRAKSLRRWFFGAMAPKGLQVVLSRVERFEYLLLQRSQRAVALPQAKVVHQEARPLVGSFDGVTQRGLALRSLFFVRHICWSLRGRSGTHCNFGR